MPIAVDILKLASGTLDITNIELELSGKDVLRILCYPKLLILPTQRTASNQLPDVASSNALECARICSNAPRSQIKDAEEKFPIHRGRA